MLRTLVNLPFRVIGKAARVVQARQDAAAAASAAARGDERRDVAIPGYDVPTDWPLPANALITRADLARMRAEARPLCLLIVDFAPPRVLPAGADHIPAEELSIRLAELPPEGTRVIVVCQDAAVGREALRFLRYRGNDDTFLLDGGLAAWSA